ncbi:MAG: hypothetical protein Fur0032_07480 [Terrimicrobiaceae bacterium]
MRHDAAFGAVPFDFMSPQPTPAPIHDIVGPLAIDRFPVAVMVGVAALVVVLALLAVWYWDGRGRRRKPPTAGEVALAALAALRGENRSAYEFGVRISDILRHYIRDRHGLDAVNMTSLEFLQSLRETVAFREDEKMALAAFLEVSDLIKYARVEADGGELDQLFLTAENLIKAGESKKAVGKEAQ